MKLHKCCIINDDDDEVFMLFASQYEDAFPLDWELPAVVECVRNVFVEIEYL